MTLEEQLELIQEEQKVIEKNLNLSEELRKEPLSEKGYMILKELNNHSPKSGLRLYRKEAKYPGVFLGNIKKNLNLSEEGLGEEIKNLYFRRYIDYPYNMNEEFKAILSEIPKIELDETLLKMGTALDVATSEYGQASFSLTDRGLFAMIDYGLKEMNRLQELLIPLNEEFKGNSVKQEKQLQEIQDNQKILTDSITESSILLRNQDTLSKKVEQDLGKVENQISKFNENIITILSLMIAAFAVIGINISSIPNMGDNFIVGLLTVNISLCFSLVVLFYLLKVVVYNEKKTGLERLIIGLGIIFLIGLLIELGVVSQLIGLLEAIFSKAPTIVIAD